MEHYKEGREYERFAGAEKWVIESILTCDRIGVCGVCNRLSCKDRHSQATCQSEVCKKCEGLLSLKGVDEPMCGYALNGVPFLTPPERIITG